MHFFFEKITKKLVTINTQHCVPIIGLILSLKKTFKRLDPWASIPDTHVKIVILLLGGTVPQLREHQFQATILNEFYHFGWLP